MIARIIVPLFLMILMADIFVDLHYLHRYKKGFWLRRIFWWLPGVVMLVYTVVLALQRDFAPQDNRWINVYLFLVGLIIVPKFVFALCSMIGWCFRKWLKSRRNYGHYVGLLLVIMQWYILFYGTFIGFEKLTVRHVDYYSDAIPPSFDGYRIVQFSDAHVGTYGTSRQYLLAKAIDSINAQKADVIVFTGDLQNMQPGELTPHLPLLKSLRARDGVFSILGNHDYAAYIKADERIKRRNCLTMIERQRQMGWTLLRNAHQTIHRGNDSIVIAGMENYGESKRAPKRGDVRKSLEGVEANAFIVMLQHDPTCWRKKILPESNAQLTLSGHTHAMQFELGHWSPASLLYKEWGGMYYEGGRAINVSTGLGGFIPFRFGIPGEIVVITLHAKNKQ